jgi:hypothetical protein
MREEEHEDQETVVEEGTRDTMSFDAQDLPPDLEELEPVEKPPLLPSNLARGCASTVSVMSSQKDAQGSSQPQQQAAEGAAESAGLLQQPIQGAQAEHGAPDDKEGKQPAYADEGRCVDSDSAQNKLEAKQAARSSGCGPRPFPTGKIVTSVFRSDNPHGPATSIGGVRTVLSRGTDEFDAAVSGQLGEMSLQPAVGNTNEGVLLEVNPEEEETVRQDTGDEDSMSDTNRQRNEEQEEEVSNSPSGELEGTDYSEVVDAGEEVGESEEESEQETPSSGRKKLAVDGGEEVGESGGKDQQGTKETAGQSGGVGGVGGVGRACAECKLKKSRCAHMTLVQQPPRLFACTECRGKKRKCLHNNTQEPLVSRTNDPARVGQIEGGHVVGGGVGGFVVAPEGGSAAKAVAAEAAAAAAAAGEGGGGAAAAASGRCVPVARKRQGEEERGECASGKTERSGGVREHDQIINGYLNGWTECEQCWKWRAHVVDKGVPFVCSDWDIGCPQGCATSEDRSWAVTPAFAGTEAGIEETEALEYSYIENAVEFLVFNLEDAKIIKSSVVQKFSDLADREEVEGKVLKRGYCRATNKSRESHEDKHEDEIAYERYVEKLKDLLIQLESEIEEKFKHASTPFGEIAEWRTKLPAVSSVVDVYHFGWALEETIIWHKRGEEHERSKKRGRSRRKGGNRGERRKRGRSRMGDRVGNRRSGAEKQSQQAEEEGRRVTGEASARLSREEERVADHPEREGRKTAVDHYMAECERSPESAAAPESIVTKKHNGKASADEPSDNSNETPAFSVALGAGGNSGGGGTDRTSTRKEQHAAAAAAATTTAASPPPASVDTILRNPTYDEGGEELARRLAGSTQQHPHHHHNRQLQQRAVNHYIPDCERSPEIGDLHSSTDSGDDLAGDKMLGQKRDDRKKEGAVGGVVSSVVKEVDMNMDEMINMLDQEYVDNEEKLSVANSELDKAKSNRMSSEKEMNDIKDSIEKLINTIKDLSSQLSPENLDPLDLHDLAVKDLRTEHAKEQQAKEQRENIEKNYEIILKRRDEINQNKSEVQSAQSLMLVRAEKLRDAQQLKSDLKFTANRLAAMQVEEGELAQKCESQKHELALCDEEVKAKEKEAKRLLHNVRKRKRKFSELDDHQDYSSN